MSTVNTVNESIANIECPCGFKAQVINEEGTDWVELETAAQFMDHYSTCAFNPEAVQPVEEGDDE
jgi:hypothetical protein